MPDSAGPVAAETACAGALATAAGWPRRLPRRRAAPRPTAVRGPPPRASSRSSRRRRRRRRRCPPARAGPRTPPRARPRGCRVGPRDPAAPGRRRPARGRGAARRRGRRRPTGPPARQPPARGPDGVVAAPAPGGARGRHGHDEHRSPAATACRAVGSEANADVTATARPSARTGAGHDGPRPCRPSPRNAAHPRTARRPSSPACPPVAAVASRPRPRPSARRTARRPGTHRTAAGPPVPAEAPEPTGPPHAAHPPGSTRSAAATAASRARTTHPRPMPEEPARRGQRAPGTTAGCGRRARRRRLWTSGVSPPRRRGRSPGRCRPTATRPAEQPAGRGHDPQVALAPVVAMATGRAPGSVRARRPPR